MLLPLLFLPVGRWLQEVVPDPASPALSLLGVLFMSIAVPFGVLSTTGVMAQQWLADSDLPEAKNPYLLFAASNSGSLIALLGYPLLIEPFLGLTAQRAVWSVAYLGYVALAFSVAPKTTKTSEAPETSEAPQTSEAPEAPEPGSEPESNPTWGTWLYWTLLSAAPSTCLLAVTNVIALDLGSAPLVWVIPLCLYLLTFILIFGPRAWYPQAVRRFWPELTAAGLLLFLLETQGLHWTGGLVHLGVLFLVCLVGHGELHASRPPPRHLTGFYLAVSLGGWLGGLFVSLVAPHAFRSLAEYPLSVGLLALTLLIGKRRAFVVWLRKANRPLLLVSLTIFVLLASKSVVTIVLRWRQDDVLTRNVYGIYRVQNVLSQGVPIRRLVHATTVHGKEQQAEKDWGKPIGFYHPNSPLGDVLLARKHPYRAAVVGLGTGALAGHLRPGDSLTFYELDPEVERIAREHFHYLKQAKGDVDVVLGDARLNIESRAADGSLDILVIDAFSSDAIPTHLLTREALTLYVSKLKPDGLLVFHISNRFYDLRPILKATAESLEPPLYGGYRSKLDGRRMAPLEDPTKCYVLARTSAPLDALSARGWSLGADTADLMPVSPWTDDYANILAALYAGAKERSALGQ